LIVQVADEEIHEAGSSIVKAAVAPGDLKEPSGSIEQVSVEGKCVASTSV
jgi:hypothetical protein